MEKIYTLLENKLSFLYLLKGARQFILIIIIYFLIYFISFKKNNITNNFYLNSKNPIFLPIIVDNQLYI